ncbi:MAG: patatin-like phospholipase family protein [Hyphomonadaceae bacterium]|nr:patatin-like phospholipase family protein [Hyphomonadaceae bacterium]
MAMTLAEHLAPEPGPKRILALDGGGVKGILTLGMLEPLEAELRRRSGDPKLVLSDYYDLIGGTSTGAIIASGLALGMSVAELIEMYSDLGPQVFHRRRSSGLLFRSQYDHTALVRALEPVMGQVLLGDRERIKTGLSIHMKRIDTGSAWTVSNSPNNPYFDPPDHSDTIPNAHYPLIDLVRASAAAPTFFDEVTINTEWDENRVPTTPGYFVDGAVSANNNPSLQLLMTALTPEYGFAWKAGADALMMTSLGTGLRRPRAKRDGGVQLAGVKAIAALRAMIYDTQVQAVKLMQTVSDPKIAWRIDSEIQDMRGVQYAGPNAGKQVRARPFSGVALLDYQRMDVDLSLRPAALKRPSRKAPETPPQEEAEIVYEGGFLGIGRRRMRPSSVETLLGRKLSAKTILRLDELANGDPANMALLLEIGRTAGARYVSAAYPDPRFNFPGWSA